MVGQGEGVVAIVAWLFGEQSGAGGVSGAIGRGASDWKWAGGGSLQEFDWEEIKADLSEVVGTKTQSNGDALCDTILRQMKKILDTGKMKMQKN